LRFLNRRTRASQPPGSPIESRAFPNVRRRMPFKSKAQRRKFAELLVKGEITPEAYERWNRETGRKELPERVKPRKKKKKR
jgi:hypothetical protein